MNIDKPNLDISSWLQVLVAKFRGHTVGGLEIRRAITTERMYENPVYTRDFNYKPQLVVAGFFEPSTVLLF